MRIDLHLHSTASDGSLSPSELVAMARAGGLDIVALTDHDTTAGFDEACRAGTGRVHVIPGIEISSSHNGGELHMLGYYVDPSSDVLRSHEDNAITRRRDRMVAILDALRGSGIAVEFRDVEAAAGEAGLVARPHLARVLVEQGYAGTVSEAFDRWIGNACPAFRPVNLVSPPEAIERIHEASGIAVWAHPSIDMFNRDFKRFVDWGLDGLECYRPRGSAEESITLEKAAIEYDLIPTGGSDWHGPWNGRLGSFSLGRDDLAEFLERGGI